MFINTTTVINSIEFLCNQKGISFDFCHKSRRGSKKGEKPARPKSSPKNRPFDHFQIPKSCTVVTFEVS